MSFKRSKVRIIAMAMAFLMPLGNIMTTNLMAYAGISSQEEPEEGLTSAEAGEAEERNVRATSSDAVIMHTVEFIVDGEIYHTASVLHNTATPEPETPPLPTGMNSFLGWHTAEGELYDFNSSISSDLTLYGEFSEKYLIQYMMGGKVVDSVLAAAGQTIIPTSYQPVPPADSYFVHWYELGSNEAIQYDFLSGVTRNLILVPYFANMHNVFFYSEGTVVPEQLVKHGEKIVIPDAPAREGYQFIGWTLVPGGDELFDEQTPITADLTLYARWEGLPVEYTVVHWMEKVNLADGFDVDNPANYSFVYAELKQDIAGTVVEAEAIEYDILQYGDFYRASSGAISGNGTTVLNVYYVRTLYTLSFELGDVHESQVYYYRSPEGRIYQSGGEQYTITVKYEQDIADIWPSLEYDDEGRPNLYSNQGDTKFTGWFADEKYGIGNNTMVSKRVTFTADLIPTDYTEYVLNATWSKDAQLFYLNYLMQVVDTDGITEEDPDYVWQYGYIFYRDPELSQYATSAVNSWYQKDIEGFHSYYIEEDVGMDEMGARHWNFYYTRSQFVLTFDTQGGAPGIDSMQMMYQQPIDEPQEPERPGYHFTGWYLDDGCRELYDFEDAKMPARDLMIFAGWESTDYTVTFYHGLEQDVLQTSGVGYNEFARAPSEYEVGKGYKGRGIFLGWYWYNGGRFISFSFEMPVTRDFDLYAVWQTDGFTLTYHDGGEAVGTIPKDGKHYALDTMALVQDASLTRDGQRFIGWQQNGKGPLYYPGNVIEMYEHTDLYAVYTQPEIDYVNLVFDANGGIWNQNVTSVCWLFPQGTQPISLARSPEFTRPGYRMMGWSLDNDAVEADYRPFGSFPGPLDYDTVLYAVWKPDRNQQQVSADNYTGIYDGKAHTVTAQSNQEGAAIFYKDEAGGYNLNAAPAFMKAGSYLIEFMAVHPDYDDAYGKAVVEINKKDLQIAADDKSIMQGQAVPALTYHIDGFANGEDESVFDVLPQLNTDYVKGKGTGKYAIMITDEVKAENYNILFVNGTLTVVRTDGSGGGGGTSGTREPGAETSGSEITETNPAATDNLAVIDSEEVPLGPEAGTQAPLTKVPKTADEVLLVPLVIVMAGALAVIIYMMKKKNRDGSMP